jgi:hypothetical protein
MRMNGGRWSKQRGPPSTSGRQQQQWCGCCIIAATNCWLQLLLMKRIRSNRSQQTAKDGNRMRDGAFLLKWSFNHVSCERKEWEKERGRTTEKAIRVNGWNSVSKERGCWAGERVFVIAERKRCRWWLLSTTVNEKVRVNRQSKTSLLMN